ncbi:ThuA domain-containing protein [Lutimonas saemankumensis]|uniref:ThuA domain-containing protein n=1 Tax=Lutimonas saemankumensis TaxID=483016 RepID=UPI001CD3B276|nr:ThuA domain-containing protein [Lutimonas saemankumensis]MCA0931358.1 ThuA domain-containing protein [Lutimonas saemankumensis]
MRLRKVGAIWILLVLIMISSCRETSREISSETQKLKALIMDGQNNHYIWPKSTQIMKHYLEETDLFEVEIYRTDSIWLGIKYDQSRPGTLDKYIQEYPLDSMDRFISAEPLKTADVQIDFEKYDLIVSNFGFQAGEFPESVKRKFEKYMYGGGGLVVVHAANNSWGQWVEFNKMIGLGAWGGRDSSAGPYAYYNDHNEVEIDSTEGFAGSHGAQYEFLITTREPEHPIMKGLPKNWLHAQDELYDRMRGPFENATILATAYADPEKNKQTWEPVLDGSGWNVPMLMVIEYGKGRIFHTTLGHFDYSMECVGFMSTFQRGAEWSATGGVTQKVPDDFPSDKKSKSRIWKAKE